MTAPAVAFDGSNIDTDQIIPARFLRTRRDAGYADFLFHDLRYDRQGKPVPGFVLNDTRYEGAKILVANSNFGCGSSREGAVYALADYGIRCVIAPSLGDIFHNNCLKNGILPVLLSEADAAAIREQLKANPGITMTVDLLRQQVQAPDGSQHAFSISAANKHKLLEGLDDIALTRTYQDRIEAFEEAHLSNHPWIALKQNSKESPIDG